MALKGSRSSSTSKRELEPEVFPIGSRIAHVRGGLTQGDFAKSLDTHLNTIGQYERGQRVPVLDFIVRLCKVYDISYAWLLTGEGPMRPSDADGRAPPGNAGSLDAGKLKVVLVAVKEAITAGGYALTPAQEAEIITGVYEFCAAGPPGMVIPRSAVDHLLRAVSAGTKK